MKKTHRRLSLAKESLRNLTARESEAARGGLPKTNDFCPSVGCVTFNDNCFTWDAPDSCADTAFDCPGSAFPCQSQNSCEVSACC